MRAFERRLAMVLAAVLFAGSPTWAKTSEPKPGDVALSISVIAKNSTITAGEPLLVRFVLTNTTDEMLEMWSGNSSAPTTHLDILDAKGNVLAATPSPEAVGLLQGMANLSGRGSRSCVWVVSALYGINRPGAYTIRARQYVGLTASARTKPLPVLAEATAQVRVLPANRKRLDARCAELFGPLTNRKGGGDLQFTTRLFALYSVRDNAALPYLRSVAEKYGDHYACRAMRRIGTPEATAMLADLASRNDRAGKAANQAMKMELTTPSIVWEMGG